MIKVLFFSSIREQLDCESKQIDWSESIESLDDLQAELIAQGGETWAEALQQDNLVRAVNQKVATSNIVLQDGDEIAFFPPMTGG